MWNALYFVKTHIAFFSLSKWSNLINTISFLLLPNTARGKGITQGTSPSSKQTHIHTKKNRDLFKCNGMKIALRNEFVL